MTNPGFDLPAFLLDKFYDSIWALCSSLPMPSE